MNFFPILGSSFLVFRMSFGIPVLKLGKINLVPLPAAGRVWKGRKVWIFTRNRSVCNSLKWKNKVTSYLGICKTVQVASASCVLSEEFSELRGLSEHCIIDRKPNCDYFPAEENNPSVSRSVRTFFKLLGWPVWIAKPSCYKDNFVQLNLREPLCWVVRQGK